VEDEKEELRILEALFAIRRGEKNVANEEEDDDDDDGLE
jgi:hypothetical protein